MSPFRVSDAKVFDPNRGSYDLVTPFQDAITTLSSEWSLSGTVGGLSVFHYLAKFQPTQLVGNVGNSRLVSTQGSAWGDELDVVHATKYVTLTRSMAYLPGWRATAQNLQTRKVQNLPVFRHGLILSTRVPTGRWRIHWHYHAPYIELGAIASLLTGIVWIFAALYFLTGVLSKRRTRVEL